MLKILLIIPSSASQNCQITHYPYFILTPITSYSHIAHLTVTDIGIGTRGLGGPCPPDL